MRTTSTSESIEIHTSRRTRKSRRTARVLGAVAVGAALTAGLVGCGTGADQASTEASGKVPAKATKVAGELAATGDTAPGGDAGNDSQSGDDQGGSNGQPSAPKPVIDSFVTPESIDCHNGDFQEFTASWTTTHASSVMISIDGPGGYDTYGPDGETSLPFSCSSSHTFLLTAMGEGGTVTRQITLEPRNVQGPSDESSDDDEQSMPAGSTAKVSAGATGDGPATQRDCDAYATQINSLDDIAVGAATEAETDAAVAEANRYENEAMSVGCFIIYAS